MISNRLRALIARDDTIIFVGSGVSVWSGLPTWRGLLQRLAEYLLGVGKNASLINRELDNNDLLLAASYGFDQLTPQERCEFLRSSFQIPGIVPSQLHYALAQLGARCFITTNYDDLLERALRESWPDQIFNVVTPLQQLEISSIIQSRAGGFLFKPHGDISSCDSIVLTREDYRRLYGARRNVFEATRTLLASRPVIFVGFGLRDPDFLLVQDTLAYTFGVSPADHYAIMPNVVPEEADYWRRNYGIHLVSYQTDESAVGVKRHSALLAMFNDLRNQSQETRTTVAPADRTAQTLALARHARRIISTIPSATEKLPLTLQLKDQRGTGKREPRLVLGQDALRYLETSSDRIILEGPPGAGKTFLLQQTCLSLARELEQACLAADETPEFQDLSVPILISLREYREDLASMLTQTLPYDIDLEQLISTGAGAFFIDGVNEAPIGAAETKKLIDDLGVFIERADRCEIIVTTRFGNEISDLDLPVVSVDSISGDYVIKEVSRSGLPDFPLNDTTLDLLSRPLFYNAWKAGYISLEAVKTVHDIYHQLIQRLDDAATKNFGVKTALEDAFQRIAYTMVDSGQLSMPAAEVYANLRTSLPQSIEVTNFVNYTLSSGTLLATPSKGLAFFHHSVAEYFAARYLAKLIGIDQAGAVQRCLGRRDWDHALLLTLGFLPEEQAETVFGRIVEVDVSMAFRALNYVEGDKSKWTDKALEALAAQQIYERYQFGIIGSITDLDFSEDGLSSLKILAERHGSLGGFAAAAIWNSDREKYGHVLQSLTNPDRGFNYLTEMARMVKAHLDPEDAAEIIRKASEIDLPAEVRSAIGGGDEAPDYLGIMDAVGDIAQRLPQETLIEAAHEYHSMFVNAIVCRSLSDSRSQQAVEFVQQCIINGEDHAIPQLYFQLKFGEPKSAEISAPLPGLRESLLSALREGRQAPWALDGMVILAPAVTDFRLQLIEARSKEGRRFIQSLLAYAVGDNEQFFFLLGQARESTSFDQELALDALASIEVNWHGHEDLFLELVKTRREDVAQPLLESLRQYRSDNYQQVEFALSDLDWWLDWLDSLQVESYFLQAVLGEFLGERTDDETRRALVSQFNDVKPRRTKLDEFVLPHMPGLSLEMLNSDAVEWLTGQLNSREFSAWDPPVISKLATEEFVTSRLLPLLLENPSERLRENLLMSLREAGRIHRRRYVGDTGEVVG